MLTYLQSLIVSGIVIVATVVAQIVANRVLDLIESHLLEKGRRFIDYEYTDVDERIVTIFRLLRYTASAIVWVFGILTLLSAWGVNVYPVLTALGIAGLSLSFGMRDAIKDFVSGTLFLLDGNLLAGEEVKIKDIEGTVEAVGLRHVYLRDKDGNLHLIANRDLTHIVKIAKKKRSGKKRK